jgi:hypothetical protein
MLTFLEYLDAWSKELRDSLTHFLLNHSEIAPLNMEEVYSMSPEGNRYYSDMDSVGTKMQSYLSECYDRFYSTIALVLEGQPEDVLSKMHKSKVLITRTIEHRLTFCDSSRQALDLALAALDGQVAVVKEIYKGQNQKK